MAKPESTPKEDGFSNPPKQNGGQECPPPQTTSILERVFGPKDQWRFRTQGAFVAE